MLEELSARSNGFPVMKRLNYIVDVYADIEYMYMYIYIYIYIYT